MELPRLISNLVQIVGIGASVWLVFMRSFTAGVALWAFIAIASVVFDKITDLHLRLYLKNCSEEERYNLDFYADFGIGKPPTAGRVITIGWWLVGHSVMVAAIWFFLLD